MTTNITPTANDTTPDLPTPPLYIKLDWGEITKDHTTNMTYVLECDSPRYASWDLQFIIYYTGAKQSKTIKYINILLQALDRVDEPIGEPRETRFTGPLEPKNYSIYSHKRFWEGREYSTLGSAKIAKLTITYMDNSVDEITDETTIQSICLPSENIKQTLPIVKELIKLAPPKEPPIYIHFNTYQGNGNIDLYVVYIGNNESKNIIMIDIGYDDDNSLDNRTMKLKPNSKKEYKKYTIGCSYSHSQKLIHSIKRIVITYEDNTYIEILNRMIESMISDENFEKADKKLEKILREEEEAIRKAEATEAAKQEARRKACCSEIDNVARIFWKNRNDQNAKNLLKVLNEYCPNAKAMAANYLTNDSIPNVCCNSLMVLVFDTVIHVTQAQRDEAKPFLARLAPDLNSKKAFDKFKNDYMKEICQHIKTFGNAFLKTPNDQKASSLLSELNKYCPNESEMADNWLTKELVSSACGEALQKMSFDTDNMVTQAHRNHAKSFLARIAPELNTEVSYNAFKQRWSEKLRNEIDDCARSFYFKTQNDYTAKKLLDKLAEYCPNDEMMAANYLTKERLAPVCSVALQKIAYDTNIDVTEAHHNHAKSFLARIAPELNSRESFDKKEKSNLIQGILIILILIMLVVIIFLREC